MANGDKRSVSTDALETLGTIIDDNQKRDAIHLAVLPVMAGARLKPGQTINVVNGVAKAAPQKEALAIVDPFLVKAIMPGQFFWMVIKPRLITSLRHVWTHPDLVDEPVSGSNKATEPVISEKDIAFAEIQNIAEQVDCDVYQLIEGAQSYIEYGDYLCEGGRWEGMSLPDAFWPAYERYTGTKVEEDKQYSFFSCSC